MSQRNSKIVLSKGIKMDREYNQTTSLTESQLYSLCVDNTHLVLSLNNYSFIRDKGSIRIGANYGSCLQANYMCFQNPDFSNKWFFAFIDKIVYVNDNTTDIFYTIDEWSTWFDYWNPKQCFIVRQHVTSDTIGEHTEPEKIEHGPYIGNGALIGDSRFSNFAYLVVTSKPVEQVTPLTIYTNLGGIIMNGFVYYCADSDAVENIVKRSTTEEKTFVLFVYMIPSVLIPANKINIDTGIITGFDSPYFASYEPISAIPTSLDGYTPVNKKLLCYPYQYCLMENTAGDSNILRYEFFGNNNKAVQIRYYGVASIGCSIIAIPYNYKNHVLALDESIVGPKYPTLPWSEDAYTNWLTQNAVNNTQKWIATGGQLLIGAGMLAGGIAGTIASGGTATPLTAGLIAGGVGNVIGGGVSALDTSLEYYEHSREPDTFKGVNSAGDVLTSIGAMGFNYLKMSIKSEYARKIDKFLTRYGYAINSVAYPNLQHRQNYNYIQISKDDNIGYVNNHNNICVPATSMDTINKICRKGTTIWNNHTNMGDYSVSNNITN